MDMCVFIYIYVCICICMHACMYVCMYVCTDIHCHSFLYLIVFYVCLLHSNSTPLSFVHASMKVYITSIVVAPL